MRTFSWSFALFISLFAVGVAQACGSAYTTEYRYDRAGQVVGVISPAVGGTREALRSTYDAEGRIVKIEQGVLAACYEEDVLPANWPSFDIRYVVDKAYDLMGRLMSEKRSGPTLTQYSYDTVGRLECTAVRMNPAVYSSIATLPACQPSTLGSQGPDRIIRVLYDVAGRVVTEQRAYGTSVQQNYATYGYTPNGRQDWIDDANGNRTDFTYDGFDRLGRMNFPQVTVGAHDASPTDYEAYGYDNNSNLTSKRLRSEQTITYGFDALNRLEVKNLAGTATVSHTYDNFGLNETVQISGGAGISNVFDAFGRLIEVTSSSSAGSLTLTYGYDEDGNRTRVTWPDGTYVQYTFDDRNRMKQVRESNAVAGPGLLADYSYDVFGRRTNIARGNGTATTAYDYDAASRLLSLSQDLASTSRDLSLGFSYNSASQVTQRTVSNDAYSYFSMTQSKTYSRDGRNRYTTVGGMAYDYDRRGNLTSDGVRTFGYDLENHLLSITGGEIPVNLAYDPNGRLLSSTSKGVTTRYLYDGDRLVAEYNGSTLLRRYVHGAGVDEPLVWYEGAGLTDRRWLHADHQGSVVASSNGAGVGTVYAYSAYGEPAYGNWGGSRFRYTGQIMLPEAKLYHYKARVYDPVLGRFLQTDPVGYKDDFNLYAYVKGDPLNNVDSEGQACTPLNSGSIYCVRRDTYVAFDRGAAQQTRFFGAAALTVEYLADSDIVGSSILGPSTQAQSFLKQVSASLYTLNARAFSDIMAGRLSGPGLDDRMISMEQTRVQSMLDALPGAARAAIVGSINSAFASRIANALSGLNSHDRAYNGVLAGVAKGLGRPIDFAKQSDREAIGKALVGELRQSGACTVTGSRISRC